MHIGAVYITQTKHLPFGQMSEKLKTFLSSSNTLNIIMEVLQNVYIPRVLFEYITKGLFGAH